MYLTNVGTVPHALDTQANRQGVRFCTTKPEPLACVFRKLCASTKRSTIKNLILVSMVTGLPAAVKAQSATELSVPKGIARTREAHAAQQSSWEGQIVESAVSSAVPQGHAINYYGGPVMLGTVNIYYIWYGNWSGDSAVSILSDLAANLGGSPYLNINSSYYDSSLNRPTNSVRLAGSLIDNYSEGVFDPDIFGAVVNAIHSGAIGPADPSAVYFVLTSADVTVPGFKSSFCGWHTADAVDGTYIKYAFVGNAAGSAGCTAQPVSPNNNPGADSMATIIAHELSESMTDPLLNAWYTPPLQENADKCEWTWGQTFAAPNGSSYNVTLGSRQYLLQQIFANDGDGYCAMQWPAPVRSGQWFNIVAKHSGKCLDITGSSLAPGTALLQWDCLGQYNQAFKFDPVQGGYMITARHSGLQLDVAGGPSAITDGTRVVQWPYWGGTNEIWSVSAPDAQGYVTITARHSARGLDVSGGPGATADGPAIVQWPYWGGANEKFKLVPVN